MYITKRTAGAFTCEDDFCSTTFVAIYEKDLTNEVMCPCCGGAVREATEKEKLALDQALVSL